MTDRNKLLDTMQKWTNADCEEIEVAIIALHVEGCNEEADLFLGRYAELAGKDAAQRLNERIAGGRREFSALIGEGKPRS